jgi:hypothetical protein
MADTKEVFVSSPYERREAVRLLQLFRERLKSSDSTLEMLIYNASPHLGMVVKRQDLYQWLNELRDISAEKYQSVYLFIESPIFQKRVPEAVSFIYGDRGASVQMGCMLAKLYGYDSRSSERAFHLNRIKGLWRPRIDPLNKNFRGSVFYFEPIGDYDFAIAHFRNYEYPFNIKSGFVFWTEKDQYAVKLWDRVTRDHSSLCIYNLKFTGYARVSNYPISDIKLTPKSRNKSVILLRVNRAEEILAESEVFDSFKWSVIGNGNS